MRKEDDGEKKRKEKRKDKLGLSWAKLSQTIYLTTISHPNSPAIKNTLNHRLPKDTPQKNKIFSPTTLGFHFMKEYYTYPQN